MFKNLRKNKKGFSLVELIVVITIITILVVFLVPSFVDSIEDSHAKKDSANMENVTKSVKFALSDFEIYKIASSYATRIPVGYTVEKEGTPGKWSSETIENGMTITFYSTKKNNTHSAKFSIANAIVNKGIESTQDGSQIGNILLPTLPSGETGSLYQKLINMIGDSITLDSQTYKNSNYTIFIIFGENLNTLRVYGQWNGINLKESVGLDKDDPVVTPPVTDDHTHDFVVVSNTATCTKPGTVTYKCSCGETRTESSSALGHNYNSVVTAPTCTTQGYTTHTCSRCNDSYVDSYVDALGHNYEWVVDKPATETETGLKHEECTNCGDKRNENTVINKLTCTHSGMTGTAAKAATCTSAGNSAYWYCSNCNKYFSDSNGQSEIAANSWIIAALDHSYDSVVTAPTCTAQGYTTHTCTRCGYSYKNSYVDALGHDWQWVIDTPATITTTGLKHEECSRCHIKRNENTVIDKLTCAHSGMTGTAAKAATCTSAGNSAYWYCSTCNKYFSDSTGQNEIAVDSWVVDALGHDFTAENVNSTYLKSTATCTSPAIYYKSCDRCELSSKDQNGEATFEYGSTSDHNYNSVVTNPTCTSAGYTTYTCSVCEDYYVDDSVVALGHNTGTTIPAVAATCSSTGLTEGKKCSRCGIVTVAQTVVAKKAHTRGTYYTIWPNCFDAGTQHCTCKVCGASYTQTGTKIGGHKYGDPTTSNGYTTYMCINDLDGRTSTSPKYCGHGYGTVVITADNRADFGYTNDTQQLDIPETITKNGITYTVVGIGDDAFSDCTNLVAVEIPSTVTSIGNRAFANCTGLLHFNASGVEGIKTIGEYAFYGCEKLFDVSGALPASVTSIGSGAFSYCESLISITIPDGITTINDYTFYGCWDLVGITLPASIRSIGDFAIYTATNDKLIIIFKGTVSNWSNIDFGNDCIQTAGGWTLEFAD